MTRPVRSAPSTPWPKVVALWSLLLLTTLVLVLVTGVDRSLSGHLCRSAGIGGARRGWQALSALADPAPITVLAVGSAMLALAMRRPWQASVLVAVPYAAALTTNMLKEAFERHRPEEGCPAAQAVMGFSFPSGHAVGATTGGLLVVLWLATQHERVLIPLVAVLLLAGLISFSRVMLGVHFLTDVLTGQLWGTAWAVFGTTMLHRRPVVLRREWKSRQDRGPFM